MDGAVVVPTAVRHKVVASNNLQWEMFMCGAKVICITLVLAAVAWKSVSRWHL